jgi:hypothetical protein
MGPPSFLRSPFEDNEMVKTTITQTGSGHCALSGYDGEGLTVAFDSDQPLFLTWRSFKQLLALRLAQSGKQPAPVNPPRATTTTPDTK